MAIDKKLKGIIFLNRNSFDYYSSNLTNILRFNYQPTSIRDLDVISKENLILQIKSFIETNKLIPCSVIILMSSDICFEKDLLNPKEAEEGVEIQNFLDNIPFENTSVRLKKFEKGYKVIVANKDLYESITNAFEKLGFITDIIIPIALLEKEVSTKTNLDQQLISYIFRKLDVIKKDNLLTIQETPGNNHSQEKSSSKKLNKRLIALISVFGLLLIILTILMIQTFSQPSPQKASKTSNKPLPASAIKTVDKNTTNESKDSTTSAIIDISNVKIYIKGLSTSKQIAELKKNLSNLGFKEISVENTKAATFERTLVIFKTGIPENIQEKIINETQKISPNISTQETSDAIIDITIILGKNL